MDRSYTIKRTLSDITGRISKIGDEGVRTALYESRPHHPDTTGQGLLGPQELGHAARQARRHEEGESGARPQACRDHASHAGRRKTVQFCRRGSLTKESSEFNRFRAGHNTNLREAKSPRRDDGSGQTAKFPVASRPRVNRLPDPFLLRPHQVAALRRPRTEARTGDRMTQKGLD